MATAHTPWREEQQRQALLRRPPARLPWAQRPAPQWQQQRANQRPAHQHRVRLHQRGIPLALAPQLGVGDAAPGSWPGWGSGGFAMAAWRWTGVAD